MRCGSSPTSAGANVLSHSDATEPRSSEALPNEHGP